MAILNEWAVTGPNYFILTMSIIFLVIAALSIIFMTSNLGNVLTLKGTFILLTIMCVSLLFGWFGAVAFNEPAFYRPTGQKYIEATFANGSPTAAILQKYDVIDTDGKVYTLREKKGVKDEKRPKVKIYEEKAE